MAIPAVLTTLVRRSLPGAPAFIFESPQPGSGETLLAHAPSWIATRTGPHLRTIEDNATEEKKSLFAAIIENPTVILIDNVDCHL